MNIERREECKDSGAKANASRKYNGVVSEKITIIHYFIRRILVFFCYFFVSQLSGHIICAHDILLLLLLFPFPLKANDMITNEKMCSSEISLHINHCHPESFNQHTRIPLDFSKVFFSFFFLSLNIFFFIPFLLLLFRAL